jgi:Fic family protein
MTITINHLKTKKQQLDKFRPLPPEMINNLDEWFKVELTYTSNAIEGNTLSRQETAIVIEKGLTVEGKSLKEHLEATNHAEALDFIKTLAHQQRQQITESTVLNIHNLILQKIDYQNAGRYRSVPVRIAGVNVTLPNPTKVPDLMTEYAKWLQDKNPDPIVKIAADAHFKLVSIHPFVDGNGRTARLLMNLLLIQKGYPPTIIGPKDRRAYLDAIEKGQTKNQLSDYYQVIYQAIDRSLDIYLEMLQPQVETRTLSPQPKLLKIGQLAQATGESVPTIRYWTKLGLLPVSTYTKGNYQLYQSTIIKRIKQIRNWQTKHRLTLSEIKQKLKK